MSRSKSYVKALAAISAAVMAVTSTGICASADGIFSSKALKTGVKAAGDILEDGSGYTGNLTFTPTAELSEYIGLDVELKEIGFGFDTSVVGALIGLNGNLTYGSESLGNVEVITDSDTGKVYMRIPELSDSYLYIDMNEIEFDEEEEEEEDGEEIDIEIDFDTDVDESLDAADLTSLLTSSSYDELKSVLDALGKYTEVLAPVLGVGENGVKSGEIYGIEYTYGSVTYTLNYTEVKTVVDTLAEAAAEDEDMLELANYLGYGDSVKDMLDDYFWAYIDESDVGDEDAFTISLYTSGTELTGFSYGNPIEQDDIVLAVSGDSSAYSRELRLSDSEVSIYETDSGIVTVNADGSLTGKTSQTLSSSFTDEEDVYTQSTTTEFEDLFVGDGSIKGTIKIENEDSDEGASTDEFTLDVTEDKQSVEYKSFVEGVLLFTLRYEGEKTDAWDVKIPEGDMYNALDEDELNAYLENADVDGFAANAEKVLGSELYELLFGEMGSDEPDDPDDSSKIEFADSIEKSETSEEDNLKSSSASSSSSAAKTGDPSPDTGSAAAGLAAVTLFAAGAVIVKKRR